MRSNHSKMALLLAIAALSGAVVVPSEAEACGGFFCSQAAPVNQAAERIIFSENGDGTVTAVIQIMYEGPAESFSWLLPISTVPGEGDIGIASDIAFQRLQSATNPQYTLQTRVEGTCKPVEFDGVSGTGGASAAPGSGAGGGLNGEDGGVVVAASGIVGSFEWTVISLDDTLDDPAEAAATWLRANGYDVPPGAPGLLRPYLEDGLHLLALKLVKGADTGSIRPIVLTYAADKPMIPIKLTAVAANDDMGVMTWVVSSARSVPQNYLGLELNEARINWFNPSSNYNEVVIAAADDAGGQGFVTEYAAASSSLDQTVWADWEEQQWQAFRTARYESFQHLFDQAFNQYSSFDGFWDATRTTVTLPAGVAFEDFRLCPSCYSEQIEVAPSAFIAALDSEVIEPVRRVQTLLGSRPYVTRLYTTMSAAEMTADPLFTFNPDLPDVSNVHTAERVIECSPDIYQSEAPWRIELPGGGVVRGTADQVGTWPNIAEQPANLRILRMAESGPGAVLEDNSELIEGLLEEYNATLASTPGGGGSSGSGGRGPGTKPSPNEANSGGSVGGGGCSVGGAPVGGAEWGLLVAAAAWIGSRRRRALARR